MTTPVNHVKGVTSVDGQFTASLVLQVLFVSFACILGCSEKDFLLLSLYCLFQK